jgi:hypothetical protein
VALEGGRLDARGLLPADMSLYDLLGVLARAPLARRDDKRTAEADSMVSRLLQSDLDLQLKAGQLVTAGRTYRDFGTAVVTKGGQLKQLLLQLSGDAGFNLQLEGKVDNLATVPKGIVRGHLVAETPDSIAPLAALLGVPAGFRPGDGRERSLVPLRLAGALALGGRTATSADLTVDGETGGAVVKVNARFDGGTGGWRSGRADITATADSTDAARIVGLLFPEAMPAGRVGSAKSGRILIRAGGVPAEGLTSVATVDAADLALNFRGQVVLADTGAKADGDLEARAASGTPLAALVGLTPALRADGIPVNARLKLGVDGSTVTLDRLALQIGGTKLTGKIAVTPADGRRRIDASLAADDLSLATVLGPLLDRRFGAASAAEAVLLGQASPWPDEPFNAAVLDAFDGQIQLSSKRLTLADGLGLERARIDVQLKPGKIEAREIGGRTPGGEVKAAVSIEKVPGGASVRGTLGFGIALEEVPGPRPPKASGPVSGRLEFAGRGVSPRAVLAALQGEGTIALGEARLPGLAPGAVAAAAGAALKAEPGKLAPVLRQALAAGLAAGSLPVAQASFPLEIADGQVRARSLALDTGEGRAVGTARLDLKALKLDTQWRIEAKVPEGATAVRTLPPVILSYRAPLAALGTAEQQTDTTALEQELAARKIEQDMEELERLRRLNEADPARKPADPAAPAPRPPALPGAAPIPPFGTEVRPGTPG